jgi:hypothetical protein
VLPEARQALVVGLPADGGRDLGPGGLFVEVAEPHRLTHTTPAFAEIEIVERLTPATAAS